MTISVLLSMLVSPTLMSHVIMLVLILPLLILTLLIITLISLVTMSILSITPQVMHTLYPVALLFLFTHLFNYPQMSLMIM